MQLTQDSDKRLEAKDVEKYYKRYEAYVGAKTTETFVDSFLSLYMRAVGAFVPLKDAEALHRDLQKDYVITRAVHLRQKPCAALWAHAHGGEHGADHGKTFFSVALGRNADGFPLSGVDEVPARQSTSNAKQLDSIAE